MIKDNAYSVLHSLRLVQASEFISSDQLKYMREMPFPATPCDYSVANR